MKQDSPTVTMTGASTEEPSAGGPDATQRGRPPLKRSPILKPLPTVDVDRYDFSGEFAHGAMGRILQAWDPRLDRPVAIKELLTRGGDMEPRFVTEALITARLQHPAIVPVYEAGRWKTTGSPFYAMKLVSGRSLASIIAEKRTLEERLALLPHVLAVAEAIAYAHSERIIHRDLKPSNVLVGNFGETVVIDWGLAKALTSESASTAGAAGAADPAAVPAPEDAGLTHHGMVVGTPAYMPPEQAMGQRVDERADVYALGAILYHLLAGNRPYEGSKSAEVISAVVKGPPAPLGERQKGIPADLLAIVDKAMSRSPAERYATALEFAEDLRRFQTGQIVGAHVYSLQERARRFVRRHKGSVSVTAVALLTLLMLGAVSIHSILVERDRAEQKQAEAELARRDSERARQQALERADELTLVHARTAVERDPNEAIAWLRSLSPSFTRWSEVRTIAADARAHGFAHILQGHTQTVNEVAFSRDGKYLLTGSDDHTVRIWNLEQHEARVFTGHTDEVWRLELSPDGRFVASAGKERAVRLWELATGETRWIANHPGPVYGFAFTPDGQRLITGSRGDDVLRFWDVATGALVRTLPTGLGPLNQLALSPDGRYAVVQSRQLARAQLWDLERGTSHTLDHGGPVTAVCVSPRGDFAATGALDGTVRLWELRTGQARVLAEKQGAPSKLAFSVDGARLAVGNTEGLLRLWTLSTGRSELVGSHEGRINQVRFSRDGRFVATSSDDRTARLWDLTTGQSRVMRGHRGAAFPLDFSPDGQWLAVGSYDATTRLFAVATQAHRVLAETPAFLDKLAASADGRHLATLGNDGALYLFDVTTGATTLLEHAHTSEPFPFQFSPDGHWLAVGGQHGRLRLRDVATGASRPLEGHLGPLTALAFSRNGRMLASADAKGAVRLWEVDSGQGHLLEQQEQPVLQLTFSPDYQRLALGNKAGEIHLWDLASGKSQVLRGHEDEVRGLVFSSDGQRLVSGSMDHTLRIWNLASGESRRVDISGSGVQQILMTSDDQMVISSSVNDSALRLWDSQTGAPRGMLRGHQGDIFHMTLSPDGRRLASAGPDRTVRLWDLATQESRVLRGHTAAVTGAVFLDDQHLASASWDRTVRVWRDDLPMDPGALRAWMLTIDSTP
ncbi:WD40 repeat domain-containing serine/threonine protein kinase [Hyalangium minutum]|uniref:Putative serine/threonine-protein kinase pkwA n=1 Tax=Hyalangium minutum TaxID=394096 RepID=A0A085WEG7_9BACT|nr:protein kinase [Hyalangium minutum]KFE66080.1 putative serine/threonine-protein kinase pkwA [Hyalangium minutum]